MRYKDLSDPNPNTSSNACFELYYNSDNVCATYSLPDDSGGVESLGGDVETIISSLLTLFAKSENKVKGVKIGRRYVNKSDEIMHGYKNVPKSLCNSILKGLKQKSPDIRFI